MKRDGEVTAPNLDFNFEEIVFKQTAIEIQGESAEDNIYEAEALEKRRRADDQDFATPSH